MHPDNKIVSFVVITDSYRRFRTHFVRGVKVRLFLIATMIGRCARMFVIFRPRDTKVHIAHRLANRIGRCQPSATSPLFFDNLHFEHFDKSVNHKSTLKCLSKCSKWRLSKKRGLVADGCPKRRFWKAEQTFRTVFSKHFSHT